MGKLAISICGGDGGWDCFSAGWFGGTALVVVGGVGCILIHYVNITVKMQLTETICLDFLHIQARGILYRYINI